MPEPMGMPECVLYAPSLCFHPIVNHLVLRDGSTPVRLTLRVV